MKTHTLDIKNVIVLTRDITILYPEGKTKISYDTNPADRPFTFFIDANDKGIEAFNQYNSCKTPITLRGSHSLFIDETQDLHGNSVLVNMGQPDNFFDYTYYRITPKLKKQIRALNSQNPKKLKSAITLCEKKINNHKNT